MGVQLAPLSHVPLASCIMLHSFSRVHANAARKKFMWCSLCEVLFEIKKIGCRIGGLRSGQDLVPSGCLHEACCEWLLQAFFVLLGIS